MLRRAVAIFVFGLALMAGLGVPASAEEAPAVVQGGCGLDLTFAPAAPEAGICPVKGPADPAPEFLAGGRTCRCSCGRQPCKTDSDCGPGGNCTAGITCC